MNKSMMMGLVAGVGVATAGGVLGYQFLGTPTAPQGSAEVVPAPEEIAPVAAPAVAATRAAPAPAARPAPAPRPAQPVAAPVVAAAPVEECWDEEVTVTEDPKDQHQIAGTALGAVVGGAIGKDVGDRDITTAAGAAAGALIGRKIQQRIQDNREEQRTTTTTVRRCAPAGSR
jgi:uncharacterized protein YcfJ